eukprot:ctg_701.g366
MVRRHRHARGEADARLSRVDRADGPRRQRRRRGARSHTQPAEQPPALPRLPPVGCAAVCSLPRHRHQPPIMPCASSAITVPPVHSLVRYLAWMRRYGASKRESGYPLRGIGIPKLEVDIGSERYLTGQHVACRDAVHTSVSLVAMPPRHHAAFVVVADSVRIRPMLSLRVPTSDHGDRPPACSDRARAFPRSGVFFRARAWRARLSKAIEGGCAATTAQTVAHTQG